MGWSEGIRVTDPAGSEWCEVRRSVSSVSVYFVKMCTLSTIAFACATARALHSH